MENDTRRRVVSKFMLLFGENVDDSRMQGDLIR
jgi:hypothetical protein